MRRVVMKPQEVLTVSVEKIHEDKLYFLYDGDGDIYKLHQAGRNKWAFVRMLDSSCWFSGSYPSMVEAVKSNSHKNIFEFVTLKEALNWMQGVLE